MELFSLKSFHETDRVGLWYKIAKSLGRNDVNIFGRGLWNANTHKLEKVERRDFSHSIMDGAGAMVTDMRELGDTEIEFPSSARNIPPKLFQRTGILLASQKLMSQARATWKSFDPHRNESQSNDFYVFAFNEAETTQIRTHCRTQAYSSNAWLIHLLQNATAELLANPDSRQGWLLPVNMRGGVSKPNPAANQSSAVPLFVSRSDSPQLIHQQLKERLAEQIHWGNWWAYNLGALLGEKRMRKLFAKSSEKNFWMGTMSDMGSWKSGSGYQSLGDREVWFATPPGSLNYPIGCIQFTFNDRLSITLRVHPFITPKNRASEELAQELEAQIRKALNLTAP